MRNTHRTDDLNLDASYSTDPGSEDDSYKAARDDIDRIRKEQDFCWDVLDLWNLVQSVGIDPTDVVAFTFRPEFLNTQQHKLYQFGTFASRRDASKHWHNCVRLVDGELKAIPLCRRPKQCD